MFQMYLFVASVAWSNFISTFATGTFSCNTNRSHESQIEGFKFLQKEQRFYLVMTTILLETGYELPNGTTFRCVSAVTTDKDDDKHTVLQTVDYRNGIGGKWDQFSQEYQFVEAGGYLNRMNIIDINGAPSGNYDFIYTIKNCAVLKVENFERRATEAPAPTAQARSDTNDNKYECMVWAKDAKTYSTEKFCEHYFTECCKPKVAEYEYTPDKCQIPSERSDL